MAFWKKEQQVNQLPDEQVAALQKWKALYALTAVIEFTPSGEIVDASPTFLSLMGYSLPELKGQKHSIFCVGNFCSSAEYSDMWNRLRRGDSICNTFHRQKKNGEDVWLEGAYLPVKNKQGEVVSVLKVAKNLTVEKKHVTELEAMKSALEKSMAVIEFQPDGTIVDANPAFLAGMGYSLEQIKGKHHRMFCDDAFYQDNPNFWAQLAEGHFKGGQYERFDANGESVWLEATYNPIFDLSGKNVTKVIKFASVITEQVQKNQAVAQAAELSFSTAEETAEIARQGADMIGSSVAMSNSIVTDVTATNQTIEELNEQSVSIGAIVSTIRGIADQTNLLALNAAIEAARAGDQGRGFAVVADEVRQLAARTSNSTLEIEEVVRGNKDLAQSVSERMQAVIKSAESSNEQLTQVNGVMTEIYNGASNVSQTVSALLK